MKQKASIIMPHIAFHPYCYRSWKCIHWWSVVCCENIGYLVHKKTSFFTKILVWLVTKIYKQNKKYLYECLIIYYYKLILKEVGKEHCKDTQFKWVHSAFYFTSDKTKWQPSQWEKSFTNRTSFRRLIFKYIKNSRKLIAK